MPVRVRNWADPDQRLIAALDRDLDKLVRLICSPDGPRVHSREFCVPPKNRCPAQSSKACCEAPCIIYCVNGHDYVCQNCGACTHAAFDEVGNTVQYEVRQHASQLEPAYYPYDRNKHFRKILRDVTNMHIRVPRTLVLRMHKHIGGKPTVAKVRTFLKNNKLYHYYTSCNNIARMLGDKTQRIALDTRAYECMCREADVVSTAFNEMKAAGLLARKNFVNAQVLILHIATRKFKLPEIARHLRLPRPVTAKKHEATIDEVYEYLKR